MVAAASYEARKFGVHSALPLRTAYKMCPTRRTNEIGIRMALGAERSGVLWMVMRESLTLVLVGVAIGIAGALAAGRLISIVLYDTKATDPLTITASALVMIAVAALAGYLPARRAAKVDPMVALRYE